MMEATASPRKKKPKQKVENRRLAGRISIRTTPVAHVLGPVPVSSSAASVADQTQSPPNPNTPEVQEEADHIGQRIIRLKEWLISHSGLTFSVLLLAKMVMWIFLAWMGHLTLGWPGVAGFLVVLVKQLYNGPLQKALEWAWKKMQRKKKPATHGETHK